jgi:hypothetical protein
MLTWMMMPQVLLVMKRLTWAWQSRVLTEGRVGHLHSHPLTQAVSAQAASLLTASAGAQRWCWGLA